MTTLTVDGQNSAADGVAADYGFIALYDGDPEGAGSELTGGAPAYARKAVTWPVAAAGVTNASNVPITFDIPAGVTVDYWAYYSALTVGTRGASGAFAAAESYTGQGTFDVTAASIDPLAA